MLAVLVCLSVFMVVIDAAPSGSCVANGYRFQDGSIFTVPGNSQCMKHRCDNGYIRLSSEGCEVDGQCYNVGNTFIKDCIVYTCAKSYRGNFSVYTSSVTRILCQDVDGVCRRPGTTFKYSAHGRIYNNCQCSVRGSYRSYSCTPEPGEYYWQ